MNRNTLRPGVFSEYTLTRRYAAGRSPRHAALLCRADWPGGMAGEEGSFFWVESYAQAVTLLAADGPGRMLPALGLLFGAGAGRVCCLPLPEGAGEAQWADALESLAGESNLYALVCEGEDPETLAAVRRAVLSRSAGGRECLAFCGCELPATAATLARELGCERMVLSCPAALPAAGAPGPRPLYAACALAGAVLSAPDPAASFSGCALEGLSGLSSSLTEDQVELLLEAGVTPLERLGDQVEAVRLLTTRVSTDGTPDRAFTPVNTVLILDDVLVSVREALRLQLKGARNTPQGLDAIASQVTVLLQAKADGGLITGYSPPRVSADPADATVCLVELSFGVAYAVNQIHITAHVLI